MYPIGHILTILMLKILQTHPSAHLSQIWKLKQFTRIIRKVFVTKILLFGKFLKLFLTLSKKRGGISIIEKNKSDLTNSLAISDHFKRNLLLDPILVIALPCIKVSLCSCWIFLKLLELLKLLHGFLYSFHGFVKIDAWISLSSHIYLSKLIHGSVSTLHEFVKIDTWISLIC